jgi:hypothetical protein
MVDLKLITNTVIYSRSFCHQYIGTGMYTPLQLYTCTVQYIHIHVHLE